MRTRGLLGGLFTSAAVLLAPALTNAQDVRDLDNESSNVRSFAGSVGEEPVMFEVAIPAASAMRIDVITTSELDPKVKVTDAATGELLAEDDDSGGDLSSRVTVRGEDGRRVRIEVSRFSYDGMEPGEGTGGTFDLRLTTMAHDPQSLRSVAYGSALGGTLLTGDRHEFTFTGEAGKLLEVALLASEESGLDPYLELRDPAGEVIASNDDGGGSLNSVLRHVLQDGGDYTIVASAFGSSSGEYTLRVAEAREFVTQAPVQVIGFADPAAGRLGEGYENGGIDPAFIDYQLSDAAIAAIVAGRGEVTIRMNADEGGASEFGGEVGTGLDPLIELGFDTPLGFAVVESDDDGSGTGLNAMLPIDLSSIAGDRELLSRLRVRAKALSAGGGYTLTITEGMEARPAYDIDAAVESEAIYD